MKKVKLFFLTLVFLITALGLNAQRSIEQKMDSVIIKTNNGNGQLLLDYKNFYNYNSFGQDTLKTEYEFGFDSFILDAKTKFKYDSNGNLTMETRLKWNQNSSALVNSYNKYWVFDTNNNLESFTYSYWVDSLAIWKESYKETFNYDSNSLLTLKTMLNFDESNNIWVNYHRESYWYNSNQKLDSFLLEVGSQPGGTWFDHSYITYKYNPSNLLILSQEYRFLIGSTIPTDRDTFIYDANNLLLEHSHSYFHSGSSTWYLYRKEIFNYDFSENLIKKTTFRTNATVLQPEKKETYVYDESIPFSQIIISHQYEVTKSKLLENTVQFWQSSTSTWDTVYYFKLHYSDFINSIHQPNLTSIYLFPNPSKNEVFIKGLVGSTPYFIFDLHGKLVMQGRIKGNESINLESISNGVYVVGIANKRLKLIVGKY